MTMFALRKVLLIVLVFSIVPCVVSAQDLDDILKGALKTYLEEKAEEAGIDVPGRSRPKNIAIRFTGAENPSIDTFEALYVTDEPPVATPPPGSAQSEAETNCFNRVQGKIAWNTSGSKRWNANNIRKLCGGATIAAAPPTCFYNAMFRGNSWGKKAKHKMNWMLATQLCARVTNASTSIACLKSNVASYSLQNAVNSCDQNPKTVAVRGTTPPVVTIAKLQERECYRYVQGRIAWDVAKKNKNWSKANVQRLCKGTTAKYSPGNCFSYAIHKGAQWGKRPGDGMSWSKAIDLCEGTSNANKTTTCFKNSIAAGKTLNQAISRCDK